MSGHICSGLPIDRTRIVDPALHVFGSRLGTIHNLQSSLNLVVCVESFILNYAPMILKIHSIGIPKLFSELIAELLSEQFLRSPIRERPLHRRLPSFLPSERFADLYRYPIRLRERLVHVLLNGFQGIAFAKSTSFQSAHSTPDQPDQSKIRAWMVTNQFPSIRLAEPPRNTAFPFTTAFRFRKLHQLRHCRL